MGRSAWTIVLDAKLVTESRIVIDIPLGWNNWSIELNHWLIDWIIKPKNSMESMNDIN